MSISEQVKELRNLSFTLWVDTPTSVMAKTALSRAADTIESLSAKLADMERSAEGKYTIEQIIDAIVQADDEIICAIQYRDREGLEDVLKDYLH